MSEQRVSSARASEIVGVGYEGFRSYLKRGLLGRVGMLPGFHAPGAATSDDPMPRAGWQMFGFVDLCLIRLAKMLIDNGFTFASANSVVSQHRLWDSFRPDGEPVDRYLLLWPPYGDHIVFEPSELGFLPAPAEIFETQAPVGLAREHAAHGNAQTQDVEAKLFSAFDVAVDRRVIQNERMQISVAGMKYIGAA